MADLRVGTLMISIQAVRDAIADLELLLRSETLKDRAEIEDLLFTLMLQTFEARCGESPHFCGDSRAQSATRQI